MLGTDVLQGVVLKPVADFFGNACLASQRLEGPPEVSVGHERDDTPIPLYLGGRAAALVKEQVCKGTLAFLRKEARKPGAYFWLKSAKRAKALDVETA